MARFGRLARLFRDLPLSAKVLIAPAACCVAGLAVAVSIWFGASQSDVTLAEIADKALPTAAASLALLESVDHVQALAMRTIVWQEAGVPDAQVATLGQDVLRAAASLHAAAVAMIAGRRSTDTALPRLRAIETRSAAYARLLADAIDLVSDPAIAVGYFRRADTLFETLRTEISALATEHRAVEAASVQRARGEAHANMVRFLWISTACALVLAILLPFVVRAIGGPVRMLTRTMTALAAGDLTADVAEPDRRDELGGMARAVRVFRQHALDAQGLMAVQVAEEAAKERRRMAVAQSTEAFGASVTGVLAALVGAAAGMRQAADALAGASGGVRTRAGDTAAGAGAAARDLTAVGAAVAQLAGSVDEIARQVAAASDVAREAVQRSETSHARIRDMAQATARIGDVVHLISDIAGQTNLLALNATIEAARAGEAGKGFAVVANEVKALATQTARATGEIGQQIASVRTTTEEAVQAMAEVGQAIARMDAVTGAIAAAVEQQSATSRQIADNVQSVSDATQRTTQAMDAVTSMADQAGTLSQDVLRAAGEIGRNAETLRAEVDRFLTVTAEDADSLAFAGAAVLAA
ncbi:MAG: HAMP domain-containing methyl-accepting chemotaxis protein [Acetobacteraceae bacterium]|nr:HAMP domain-containing methyl-accepting chemotaxis protein [Acetobacteraceae bacterium]